MKNFKFITVIAVVLQATVFCTATISVSFEKIPDDGPRQQNGPQNKQQTIQSSSSQTQPQFSPTNYQQQYAPPPPQQYIQPSPYNPPNNFHGNDQGPFNQQPIGGQYSGGQYQPSYQPPNNPYAQQQQQQNRQPGSQAAGSGQHPFASHPNAIVDPSTKQGNRQGSFMSLLLGSMGLHGLTSSIFGRRGPPRPPPQRNNNNQHNQQQQAQQQQQQQKPTFVHGGPPQDQGASNSVQFNNHHVQYAPPPPQHPQQHYQVSQQHNQPPPNYQQTSPSSLGGVNIVDSSQNKPDQYFLSTTQSYFEPSTHGHASNSHYEPQYQSSVGHINGPSLKYEEPPTYHDDSQIKPYTIIEKPVVHYIEKPVVRFVEKTVVRTVEKPVVRVVEKPVIKYIEKPRRGFLGKQGDLYQGSETSSFPDDEVAEGDSDNVQVIHHNYPPHGAATVHNAEDGEYYTGRDGTYFRKGGETKTVGIKSVEPPQQDNAFKPMVPNGYKIVHTHTYGPQVSGDGLKATPYSEVGKIGEANDEPSKKSKKTVKLTEQFLS